MSNTDNRCRLVLIVPDIADVDSRAKILSGALRGGDVASVIVPQYGLDDHTFQKHAEILVPLIQDAGLRPWLRAIRGLRAGPRPMACM